MFLSLRTFLDYNGLLSHELTKYNSYIPPPEALGEVFGFLYAGGGVTH